MSKVISAKIQWHPPFFHALQIELEDDMENLEFEEEHCVRKLPCRMDVLITKKDPDQEIRKDIGKIFTKYNLIEYKPELPEKLTLVH